MTMVLFLKILSPILVILLTALQFYYDHKNSDRRTKRYKRTKIVFLIAIIIAMIFSGITIYIDHLNSLELNNEVSSLKNIQIISDSLAINRESGAKLERGNLEKQILKLQENLFPFINLALQKYPNKDSSEALKQFYQDIKQLKEKATQLEERTSYLESRDEYKEIDRELKEKLVDELRYIQKTFDYIKFRIEVENGNIQRQKVAQEIKSIFVLSGFNDTKIQSQMSFGKGAPPSLVVKINKSDLAIAKLFFKSLKEYLFTNKTVITIDVNNNYEKSLIVIQLNGNPLFEKNGKITF